MQKNTRLFDRKIIFLFFFVVIGILSVVFGFFYNANQSKESEKLIEHTRKIIQLNDKLLIDVLQVESQSRGFILTGDTNYLKLIDENLFLVQKGLSELEMLTSDNISQTNRIKLIRKTFAQRTSIILNNIQLRKKSKIATKKNLAEVKRSNIHGIIIKNKISEVKNVEILLMKNRKFKNLAINDKLEIIFIFLLFFVVAFLFLIVLLVRNQKEKNYITNELNKTKNIFENLFDNNPSPICIINLESGKIINANQRFLSLFNLDNILNVKDKTFFDMGIIFEKNSFSDYKVQLNENKIVNDFEIKIEKSNHDNIWVSYSSRIINIDNIPSEISVIIDITSRIEAEIALKKSIKEITDYKLALQESYIIAITDKNGIIEFVNDNFCLISEFSKEELIGRDHRIINSGFHDKEFFMNMYSTIKSGKIWRGEIKNKSKSGKFYWVDSTIVPFLDDFGKPYQYVAIRIDITDRKLAQSQLEELNKELEGFSYSVSHDLRAPLRAMNGHAKILLEDCSEKLDEDCLKSLNSIIRNSKKMGELIDGLLEFSKLGRKELITSELNMNLIVDSVKEDLIDNNERKIEFIYSDLKSITGQPLLIKQVWVNLISNAIKYSKKDSLISIEIKSVVKDNNIIYSVKDNGVGFDMKYYDKLFGVFQRLHSAEELEGTGIGLAIVHKILQRHKGSVWAESIVDVGTVFHFSLPITTI